MSERRLGKIKVTTQLLEDVLKIPPDLNIVHIRRFPLEKFNDYRVEITLEGKPLAPVQEGAKIPYVKMIYERTPTGEIKAKIE